MKIRFSLALLMGALAVGPGQAAVIYSTNFETNQASNFTVTTSTADTECNFNYDYSTWVPTAPTAPVTSITLAPSAAGTRALKIRANFDLTGTNEGATAFVNAANGLTSYVLTFDCYQMWNGANDGSATGSTTGFTVGSASSTVNPLYGAPTNFVGWFLLVAGEGGQGASGDARYYSANNAAPVLAATTPNWAINGGTVLPIDMPGAAGLWDSVLPAAPDSFGGFAGTPGRRWVTWEILARGGQVTVSWTPKGGTKVQVAKWNQGLFSVTGLGFWDFNTGSVAVPPEDNFVLIDNLNLSEAPPVPTAANDWQMYN